MTATITVHCDPSPDTWRRAGSAAPTGGGELQSANDPNELLTSANDGGANVVTAN